MITIPAPFKLCKIDFNNRHSTLNDNKSLNNENYNDLKTPILLFEKNESEEVSSNNYYKEIQI